MGNHAAGRTVVAVVEALVRRRPTETALHILDEACAMLRGVDVEFDDDLHPTTTLGRLVIEAFAPDFRYSDAEWEGSWAQEGEWDQVTARFRARYRFT